MFNSAYYKNSELAKELSVSPVTIGRYIEQSIVNGDLDIVLINNKPKIKKTEYNLELLKRLTTNESRFKNKGVISYITTKEELYKVFDNKEILEILKNLDGQRHIPIKYAYLCNPLDVWPNYRDSDEDTLLNQKKSLIDNLNDQIKYIEDIIESKKVKINIIQVGPSYNSISKNFVDYFINKELVNCYITVGMNQAVLDLEEALICQKLDKSKVKKINYDFEKSYCKEFIFEELNLLRNSEEKTINLFICVGANLSNYISYSKIIEAISDISIEDDLLVYDLVMFHNELMYISNFQKGSSRYKFLTRIPDLLGFEKSKIILNTSYNPDNSVRSIYFELLEDTELTFDMLYPNKKIVNKFLKGEKIYLMYTKLTNFVYDYEMLQKKSYRMVKATVSHNEKFLTITAKKTKKIY